ncbi:MAG TPA: SLC13 family permease, partial [Longimicrobiales bacterium]|nr:SLC13 family permease [Longimicrobiales bacterium]
MLGASLTLAVVVVTVVLLAREWMAPDILLLAALGIVTAGGVLDLEQALSGFADPTLLAIGALFVVASGLRSTGVLRKAAHLLFGASTRLRTVLVRLTTATAVSSAFLNNTPIVAMGVPSVLSWSHDRNLAPSKLLIPLSFASILGGVCTLIGTSTNLVAD